MSLTTAQKHDLMIQFNQHRDGVFDNYQDSKQTRKDEEAKMGSTKNPKSEYNKLYKQLGSNNRNKDIREQLQEEVDMYTDNQLSTSLNQNMSPGFTMDKHNQISTFKDTFLGKTEEPVDKIYFRVKDDINIYSEAYFKSKHILSSKK